MIALPDYWIDLVDATTITVNLTGIGRGNYWVEDIANNKVMIGSDNIDADINCFYTVFAERKDIGKLTVEFEK